MNGVRGARPHRHGSYTHEHHHRGPHRHLAHPVRSAENGRRRHHHDHHHHQSRGRVDRSIVRSRAGVHAVLLSLAALGITAALQALVFMLSGSVALLADLVHNGGDALTAVPIGIAFVLRSETGERRAGYLVVLAIVVSAAVAGVEAVDRLLHPQAPGHLVVVACAGLVGFAGNEVAARIRLRAGRRLDSPALLADGAHARSDGFVSLGVVASAGLVALGFPRADPIIGLAITALILVVAGGAWRTVRHGADH